MCRRELTSCCAALGWHQHSAVRVQSEATFVQLGADMRPCLQLAQVMSLWRTTPAAQQPAASQQFALVLNHNYKDTDLQKGIETLRGDDAVAMRLLLQANELLGNGALDIMISQVCHDMAIAV